MMKKNMVKHTLLLQIDFKNGDVGTHAKTEPPDAHAWRPNAQHCKGDKILPPCEVRLMVMEVAWQSG